MAGQNELTAEQKAAVAAMEALPRDARFLVAASGGADSAVAAWALVRAVGAESVRAIHLDHGRPDSRELLKAAVALGSRLGIELFTVDLGLEDGPSWEARARTARYREIEAVAAAGELVVTGHHADDDVETLLGNLLRGAGARGLSGIPGSRGIWRRPLLGLHAETIRAVATQLDLPFHDDADNDDPSYRRNRIRHRIIPALEAEEPATRALLKRSADHLAADDALLESQAAEIGLTVDGGALMAPLPVLATMPRPVAVRAIASLVREVRPPYGPTAAEIDAILDVVAGTAQATEIGGGIRVEREGASLAVFSIGEAAAPEAVVLQPPGAVRWGSHDVVAEPVGRPDRLNRRDVADVDADLVGDRLVVRAPVAGERIEISGGTKSIRDAMAEAGIPNRKRSGWPVVEAHGRIVWVVGVRVADWCRPRDSTRRLLRLRGRAGRDSTHTQES